MLTSIVEPPVKYRPLAQDSNRPQLCGLFLIFIKDTALPYKRHSEICGKVENWGELRGYVYKGQKAN